MKLSSVLKSGVVVGAMFASTPVLAGGYGPAGCGVGTMILGKDATGIMGGVAMYINAAFWGPTSVTLGVMGCGDGGVASLDQDQVDFVAANRQQLLEDSAMKTEGSLLALAEVMECTNEESFISTLHNDHTVFNGTDAEVLMKLNAAAADTCTSTL